MRPNTTQARLLMMLTAVFTFFAGVFAAHGRTDLFGEMLATLAIVWLLVAVWKPGEKRRR